MDINIEKCVELLVYAVQVPEGNSQLLVDVLRRLRNACACGAEIQQQIVDNTELQNFLHSLLFTNHMLPISEETEMNTRTLAWQLIANSIVNNTSTQQRIWQLHGEDILLKCQQIEHNSERFTDICLMIIYNIIKFSKVGTILTRTKALKAAVAVWQAIIQQKCSSQFEYLHFLFEEFIVNGGRLSVKSYMELNGDERLVFLDYLHNYIKQDAPNGLVDKFLLQFLSKEFKIKSDCLLKLSSLQDIDQMKPREVYALLKCIASATGSEHYTEIYSTDGSLFLNISSLLRCLVTLGNEINESSLHKPLNKLEEVAPSGRISRDYQMEITYELKTLLVRCTANLLYNNPTNQGYCLDTQLMPVLFDCTTMDARNPLMKEWSILAIRNASINCPEIQKIIGGLQQQGQAKNDILADLNLQMGSLRINPGKD